MSDTIELEIVTPERQVVKDRAEQIQIPGRNGYLGILPGHAPLITELAVGEITYTNAGATTRLSVAWGFAEVLPDKVTILAETAERSEDIDVPRAEAARVRAQEHLKSAEDSAAYEEASLALSRAEARLAVAKGK
ncbi:MAG TPA: F0F1 ATP synthase subunit epsilon [Candidatus Saccharimonadales bacterium]|nr:F0F1 ATP synthase subunit epsilon [Candidatus Saccharimonadales bacterium]